MSVRSGRHRSRAAGDTWSIVQDLLTVGLIVVLSALADGEGDQTLVGAAGASVVAIGFLALLGAGGRVVFPRVLATLARQNSRELFVLAAIR